MGGDQRHFKSAAHSSAKDVKRFEFGRNWERFLGLLNERRMGLARDSLLTMLGLETLEGKTFLDAGSGSGLFSLAAAQLGARTIRSFDYDTRSAACTQELKRRYFPGLDSWSICRGDLLDERFVASLGRWDIVYCWGVAHHTGDMWRALELLADTVRPHGLLYVALYNDQQWLSRVWLSVKKTYCSGRLGRWLITVLFVPALVAMGLLSDILNRRNPILRYRRERDRGMSAVRDWFDWLGGYPFEVSKPEEVFRFFDKLGFQLVNLRTVGGGLGCNEFLFSREQPQPCTLGREEPT